MFIRQRDRAKIFTANKNRNAKKRYLSKEIMYYGFSLMRQINKDID